MRRFLNKRVLFIGLAVVLLVSGSAIVGLYLYLSSPQFNQRIRNFVVEKTAAYTGASVSLRSIRWNVMEQRLVLEDLTLTGVEPASEPPLGHIESITAGVRLRNLFQNRIDLFDLQIVNPEFHLRVDSKGRTNLPGPLKREQIPASHLTMSIDSLKVTGGKAIINERQVNLDFDIKDLVSDLNYNGDAQRLSVNVSYGGTLVNPGQFSIPYALATEFDLTMGTMVAHKIHVTSGKSSANLQGKIEKVLTSEIAGKLDYTGSFENAFLKHFLTKDTFGGSTTTRGVLEFSPKSFSTTGELSSQNVEFGEWKTSAAKAAYTYRFPERQLSLTKVKTDVFEGQAEGSISVASLPGKPRFTVDLNYFDVDAAQLVRVYPWDHKYMIYSRAQGHLQGWFEGRLEQYEFSGNSVLSPYATEAASGTVALPTQGSLVFALKPGSADIQKADLRIFDTTIQAQGQVVGNQADLTVSMASSNLANLRFLYADANGGGSFKGTIKGDLQKPTLDGNVVLDAYKYREWTIQHAEGLAKLDTTTEMADLKDLKVAIGDSRATVNGTAKLDGSVVNLRIQSDRIRAEDFNAITKEKVSGILSGNVTLTSLNPIKVAGRVSGAGLTARGHSLETFSGDLTYNDPTIEIKNITASELGATLKAEVVEFNQSTGALNVKADVSSLNLNRLRELGVPETLGGNIQQARITVTGTQNQPRIDGTATIENLSFRSETFPLTRLTFTTNWPRMNVTLSGIQNVDLKAEIDLAGAEYPFKADANFTDYSVEKLANFSKGTLKASGTASFKGQLKGQAPLSGTGMIQSIQASVREYSFKGAKPFPFEFDSNRLTITEGASFNGEYSTLINLKGSIGLTKSPPLDLRVSGNLDLAQVTASYQSWSVTGIVKVDGQIGGTAEDPNISGTANISSASLGREGIFTTLSALNGDVRFNENRVTFDNVEGKVGGGIIRFRGTGLIQNSRIEGMNVRIDADQVHLRYPAGLRSSVTGGLVLRGTSDEPSLEGNLKLDSMAYRSEFESFLGLFQPGGLNSGGTALDRLRLSVHIAGNRNILVQNELADITAARIDLDIKGTLASPTLTGHIEASEGTLSFQGKKYEITRGNIDFVDQFRIDPVIDIQAETDLRDYRVIIAITGKGDHVRIEPRSDPPLPQTELISLIAGGKTRDELDRSRGAGNASLPTSDQLFQGGAASILTDILRSRVGSRFGLMGLDFIRIDPHFETATNNPSLRVTLQQQVSKDLSVTYSQDLATSQQRIIMIEYFLNKNLSIVASREETNETSALGLDVKLRTRF